MLDTGQKSFSQQHFDNKFPMFARTNWDVYSQSNCVTGCIPVRKNSDTKGLMKPRSTRGLENNSSTNDQSQSNQVGISDPLDKKRFELFNKLSPEIKHNMVALASQNKEIEDENQVRLTFNIEDDTERANSYLDMYNWLRETYVSNDTREELPIMTRSQRKKFNETVRNMILQYIPGTNGKVQLVEQPLAEQQNEPAQVTNETSQQQDEPLPSQTNDQPIVLKEAKKEEDVFPVSKLPKLENDVIQNTAKKLKKLFNPNATEEEEEEEEDDNFKPKVNKGDKGRLDKNKELFNRPDFDPDAHKYLSDELTYPFRSKLKQFLKAHPNSGVHDIPIFDQSTSSRNTKKYHRPTYSPKRNAYQIDIMFTADNEEEDMAGFLVMINVNTRYLFVRYIENKNTEAIMRAISDIIDTERITIDYINGDKEKGFEGMQNNIENYRNKESKSPVYKDTNGNPLSIYNFPNMEMRFVKNDFTFHNKMVDSVIRTIRNAAGLNPNVLRDNNIVQRIVYYYNHTPHTGLLQSPKGSYYTPYDMQTNPDLEWEYIRAKDREYKEIKKRLNNSKMASYQKGNVLRVHLNWAKTDKRFKKRRMNYENIGIFSSYVNGNALVWFPDKEEPKGFYREVPIFYTDKIAENVTSIPGEYQVYYDTPSLFVHGVPPDLITNPGEYTSREKMVKVPGLESPSPLPEDNSTVNESEAIEEGIARLLARQAEDEAEAENQIEPESETETETEPERPAPQLQLDTSQDAAFPVDPDAEELASLLSRPVNNQEGLI